MAQGQGGRATTSLCACWCVATLRVCHAAPSFVVQCLRVVIAPPPLPSTRPAVRPSLLPGSPPGAAVPSPPQPLSSTVPCWTSRFDAFFPWRSTGRAVLEGRRHTAAHGACAPAARQPPALVGGRPVAGEAAEPPGRCGASRSDNSCRGARAAAGHHRKAQPHPTTPQVTGDTQCTAPQRRTAGLLGPLSFALTSTGT